MNLRPLSLAVAAALITLPLSHIASAQVSKAELQSISIPDRVETPIGELNFFDGVPTDATIDKLYSANERLAAENAQLRQHIQLQQEQAQALRADYEGMRMAFLGAVSVAFPAMKAVAKLPVQERNDVLYQYGRKAVELQSKEYVLANSFPHEQPLVQKYLPIANQVFAQTYAQMRQLESEQKAEAAA